MFDCRVAKTDGSIAEERIEGEDEKAVRVQLEEKGYLVFSIRPLQVLSLSSLLHWGFRKRIPPREFLVFNQELLALIKAGISIMRILDILIGRASHPAFQATLVGVRDGVRGGLSISEEME